MMVITVRGNEKLGQVVDWLRASTNAARWMGYPDRSLQIGEQSMWFQVVGEDHLTAVLYIDRAPRSLAAKGLLTQYDWNLVLHIADAELVSVLGPGGVKS